MVILRRLAGFLCSLQSPQDRLEPDSLPSVKNHGFLQISVASFYVVPSDFVYLAADLVLLQGHHTKLLALSLISIGTSQMWNLAL